eukprot:CAMPEP_0117442046 /NCGR_PEP_ID=MMETSP0759-20121206/3946_1 /TAXON_ID=63605 /ORGANISM="Percolomonas cosmopolitus, Strain WS" /LENGTH=288 /DNA_ID=CAMNT_0005233915 /DNA_START=655 /DNA_END=1521 /DNA_ORIENTATION=-
MDVGPYVISGRIEAFSVKKHSEVLKKELDERFSQQVMSIPKIKKEEDLDDDDIMVKKESSSSRKSRSKSISSSSTSRRANMKPNATTASNSLPQYLQSDFSPAMSPFGPLTHERARIMFCDLIQCLNICYPDYEFKNVDPSHFAKEKSPQDVMNQINISLRDAFTPEDRLAMWTLLSAVTDLQKCQVFSYHPEDEEDPLGVGNGKIWSWTYFFLNAKEKKLILFTCHGRSKHHSFDEFMSDSDSDYDTSTNPKNVDFYYPNVNKWDTNTKRASFNDDSDDDRMFEDDW